ncbi:glycoside hydrolase family 15 protein [Geodermatophilus sp. YIM 151500]|uniref:glycoside hydrolase family 15 protein n=1 Tax=Geodermatophilus sp. YIM 151500 TaxID=2984531 RepID=UPI0021E3A33F|nr:glycoside hydrolase family 15 protein [Geodermatophilus sp. YIM 151500]MCV2490884.1 glycoside hydrolase family 15 protein [Geodermatophilus sp. YIM 151500]
MVGRGHGTQQGRRRQRSGRALGSALALGALAGGLLAPAGVRAAPTAPGSPGEAATWSPGDKDGFGTAIGALGSTVWYTLNDGTLSEVFAPRIDTPSSRDTQLVVTDGETFTDREDEDTEHTVELVDPRALVYRQVNTATSGRYRITKTYTTDPARPVVLVDVLFESLDGRPYQVWLLHDVGLGLDADDDTGRSADGVLLATDGTLSSAVTASGGLTDTSSGYLGRSDGWTDLSGDHALDDRWDATAPGNVVQVGRTGLSGVGDGQRLTLALGFGPTEDDAAQAAARALDGGFDAARQDYADGWHGYLDGLAPAPASAEEWRTEYDVSAMVLAAAEDKTFRGGFVAAPGRPWAWADELQDLPVYHAVWSRDLYQIASGLRAVGDEAAAGRALDHLWTVQQRPDGSFPQNARLDGEPVFGGLQLDEVALPIVLAWQLGRTGPEDWARVRLSADFLVATGPRTEQERWENLAGFSPNTIATEIAGLVTAAEIAGANGDDARAGRYLATADEWRSALAGWTVTTTGPLSDQPYYLRITDDGDADAGTGIQIADGGPLVDQRRVLDPSFLDLVRLGVVDAGDPVVRNTLELVDFQLAYETANGRFWHRSSFDGYGEKVDGTPWEPVPAGSRETIGRGWPLLTGERGEYELAAGGDAQGRLDTMARSADDGSHLLAEQVWDDQPPSDPDSAYEPGEPTFSATPLTWSHAVFVRLAHAIDAGRPLDTPDVVACRYATSLCPG